MSTPRDGVLTRDGIVLPPPPNDREKYSYVERRLPYLAVTMSIGFVTATISQGWFEVTSGWWPFAIFTLVVVASFSLALPFSFVGPGFDIEQHIERVGTWRPERYPDVDIFLPICNEPLAVLENTWHGVRALVNAYPGIAHPYVLDDGADPRAEELAGELGFNYVVRPDRGLHKKSGNLRHAFAVTAGEFFVVLDADFVPRPDFLAETLPYMDDPLIAIVQTPQFFRSDARQTWVERAAGAVQEVFYRSIQVSRDHLGASICVGTCAVYRRAALEPQGGTTLIDYAEDVHTGLDVRRGGWNLVYVPILLATGMCPDNLAAFVRQQYRWCTGSTSTIFTRRLWTVRMTKRARCTYLSGFCYYLQTAIAVFAVPLIPICLLSLRPDVIRLNNSRLILIALAASAILVPLWNQSSYRAHEVLPLYLARGWAHALAIADYFRRATMPWQATGAGVRSVRRFVVGVVVWNGGTACVWLGLAVWRTAQFRSSNFAIVMFLGLLNLLSTIRLLLEPSQARLRARTLSAAHLRR